jgi:protein TonB
MAISFYIYYAGKGRQHLTMKSFQLALLCFICVAKSYGQAAINSYGRVVVEITKEKRPKRISVKVELRSPFPGGDSSWVQSLEKSLNQSMPVRNGAKAGKYIVSARFIISKDGTMSDIYCDTDPGFGMGEEVVRAIKKTRRYSAKWSPAMQRTNRISE